MAAPIAKVWRCLGVLLLALLSGCDRTPLPLAVQRADTLNAPSDTLKVGLAWPSDQDDGFLNGAALARQEINADGGILGRSLEFVNGDDRIGLSGTIGTAQNVSEAFADHPDLMAVIGHYASSVAIPASITYEEHGILYLATSGFRMALNRHNFDYIFRTIPNSAFLSRQQAIFAYGQGWRRVVILETRQSWAEELANGFETSSLNLDISVIFRRSFFAHHRDFRGIFADLSAQRFDLIFVASGTETAIRIISQAREMGLDVPILVGWSIGLDNLRRGLSEEEANNLLVPVMINPESNDRRVRRFINTYEGDFFTPPNDEAALGYDAVHLLAHAIETSESFNPLTVATTLRFTTSWQGVTGRHSFLRTGDIYTKMVSFEVLRDGEIDFISPSD